MPLTIHACWNQSANHSGTDNMFPIIISSSKCDWLLAYVGTNMPKGQHQRCVSNHRWLLVGVINHSCVLVEWICQQGQYWWLIFNNPKFIIFGRDKEFVINNNSVCTYILGCVKSSASPQPDCSLQRCLYLKVRTHCLNMAKLYSCAIL